MKAGFSEIRDIITLRSQNSSLWVLTYRVSFSQLGALRETFDFLLLVFPLFEQCHDVLLMGA
jgi:hypothetical protein